MKTGEIKRMRELINLPFPFNVTLNRLLSQKQSQNVELKRYELLKNSKFFLKKGESYVSFIKGSFKLIYY